MFSCEICEIFKNTYVEEHLPADASINAAFARNSGFVGSEKQIPFSKPIARAMSASRKLQLLVMLLCFSIYLFPLDYESMLVVYHGSNFITDLVFVDREVIQRRIITH